MSECVKIVAQYAQDQFYQNYRSSTDFFELNDFVFHCGTTVAAIYQQGYDLKYAELRQDRQDEVVSFSHDWLLEQKLPVDRKSSEPFVVLKEHPMSFPFDKQDTGIQEVFAIAPCSAILERSNLTEIWQQRYYPPTDRIFWWVDQGTIKFFNKGICNLNAVRVLYVPQISDNMQIPDALVEATVVNTVAKMKQLAQGVVIKKTLDQNDNKVLQTEINAASLPK